MAGSAPFHRLPDVAPGSRLLLEISSLRLPAFGTVAGVVGALLLPLSGIPSASAQQLASAGFEVPIQVDLDRSVGEMTPIWAYIGYDEANFTYLPDGRRLLTDFSDLSRGTVHVRAHNMLNTHDGLPIALKWGSSNVYTEDEDGSPVYDFSMVDQIVDTWVERGMTPVMEIGFMPRALTTHDGPYRHHWQPGDPYGDIYTGWAYPPNDYDKWADLIYEWVRHSVERYGQEEVERWWWQVWNEPNISYWQGTREEFFKLHDYSAYGLKRALPTARIGGPNTAGASSENASSFLREFLEHCRSGTNYATGEVGSPVDFFGFHAKGSPTVTSDGHVRMGMGNQLRQLEAGFEILASFPEFRDLPVILGESDPEGCAACGRQFGYPEMVYRNGTMFSSYTAASFAKKFEVAERFGTNFQGAISWTFTFPDQPLFSGFRSFSSTHGINKPVLNVMRMFGMMGGERVAVDGGTGYSAFEVIESGVRAEPDVGALASLEGRAASVMVWHYHDDDVAGPAAAVQLEVSNVPAERVRVHHYRIDEDHSNAFTTWREMGAPQQLTDGQLAQLREAAELAQLVSPRWADVENGRLSIPFELPRQGVSLVQVSW
ncbi:MAG: beta-xylosidase [Gemmatimonadota bacterium]